MAKSSSNGATNGVASTKTQQQSNHLSYRAILFMALLALQFGIQPIVTKKYTSPKIIKSTVIFMQEVVKLVIAYVGISLGGVRWKDVMSGECRDMIHAAIVMY
jgi:hypothetical protein